MARISPYTFFRAFDNNGAILSGGKLYTYEAGTSTPKVTYTDAGEGTPNDNPIILDAYGEADIWLGQGAYKFVLYDKNDVLQRTVDDVIGDTISAFGSSFVSTSTNLNITSVYENSIVLCDDSLTLSLLPAATADEGFYFIVKNIGSGTVTIDPDASETINNASTYSLEAGASISVNCNGSEWYTLFEDNSILDDNNTFTGDNIFQGDNTFEGDSEFTGSISATTATPVSGDFLLFSDIDDSNNAKKATIVNTITPALLDEDDMSSDSATQAPTQQSVKAYVDDNKVLSFTSSDQTITSGGLLTIAHGLSVTPNPTDIRADLVATVANNGWSIGDVTKAQTDAAVIGANGCVFYTDATNIYVRFGSAATVFSILNKSTGASAGAPNTSWNIRFHARIYQ